MRDIKKISDKEILLTFNYYKYDYKSKLSYRRSRRSHLLVRLSDRDSCKLPIQQETDRMRCNGVGYP